VLLTQSATLGHSHGSQEPPGHDRRPHFHTNASTISRPHDHTHHHHGAGGHHHHHHDGNDAPESGPQQTPEPRSPSDHDSDAFYLPSSDAVITVRSVVDNELLASPMWAVAGLSLSTTIWAYPPYETLNWAHPPPPSRSSCPLYLCHLVLLI
jgi:hypothetical protein